MSLPVLPQVVDAPPRDGGGPRNYDENYIFFWNNMALELVRLTHTIGGPQTGPPLTARFLGIYHLAIHDAYFDVFPYDDRSGANPAFCNAFKPYLSSATLESKRPNILPHNAAAAKDAVAGAAITVLQKLFKAPEKKDAGVSLRTSAAISDFIDALVQSYRQKNHTDVRSPAYVYGTEIARLVLGQLEIKAGDAGVDARDYTSNVNYPYWFDDEPSHPIRLRPIDPNNPEAGDKATHPYHGPYYGETAAILAATEDIKIADPPLVPIDPPSPTEPPSQEYLKYLEAVEDVYRMGGIEELSSTKRRPVQTAVGLFWAYDGANLIGTPPRLYNQIVKQIAFDKRPDSDLTSDQNTAEFVRLLALVNVAMADAGIYSWRDKYKYELWRPLTGVRADPTGPVPDGSGRPTWRVLGAPATNNNEGGFKPPFPSYPSGHATFGGAAFQMVRLFYDQRGDMILGQDNNSQTSDEHGSRLMERESHEKQNPLSKPEVNRNVAMDNVSFTFISDELNGVSRTLYQPYQPAIPIQNQPGDVRTRLPVTFSSLKEAMFSNAISRIWIGVHWHFDAFAGETVCEKYDAGSDDGKDENLPLPMHYQQLFKVNADGSTMYQNIAQMDWFADASQGPRMGSNLGEHYPVGGVPLGMLVANNIFDNGMRSKNSLVNLGDQIGVRRD